MTELMNTRQQNSVNSNQSLYGHLLEDRIILLNGQINDDTALSIVSQLLYLDAKDPDKDIHLYINSPGGVITSGFSIFDTMNHIRADVSTICFGQAASMGAFLLSSGAKGKRYILPSARVMIHQPMGGAQGQASDIAIQAEEILRIKKYLNGLLASQTKKSIRQIEKDTERDFFMSPKDAVKYGLVDEVLLHGMNVLI